MTRRPHGTGSVYYDATRGRYVGSYEAGWTARGTRRRRKVTGRTETEVRRKLREAMRAVETDEAAAGARPTVRTWANRWLDITRATHRPTTWGANRSAVQRWIIPTIGHRRLDQLTPGDIRSVATALLAAGGAPASARRVHAVLIKILRDALVEGHAVPPRVLELKAPAPGENDRDAIPHDHVRALLDAAKATPDYSRWLAAFAHGLRPAEALGLTWDALDLDAGTADISWQLKALPYNVPRDRSSGFRVPVGYEARQVRGAWHRVRPKTAKGQRVIPLVPALVEALRERRAELAPRPSDLVWPGDDGPVRTDAADRAAWYALQERAGVRHASGRPYLLYECRHTTASLLRASGYDDQTITAIMGHASILSTKAYIHVDRTRMREAAESLATRMGLPRAAIDQGHTKNG